MSPRRSTGFAPGLLRSGLRVVPSDGSGAPRQLTEAGPGVLAPAWSPDGRWIYYASSHDISEGSTSLWRVEFLPRGDDAPVLQRITLGETADVDPALAASGHRLAYGKVRYTPDLVELDVASGEQRQVTFASSLDDYPHLSPDGETLVFFSNRSSNSPLTRLVPGSGITMAFERRCIPPGGVARRLHTPGMRPPRALPAGRLGALGASP